MVKKMRGLETDILWEINSERIFLKKSVPLFFYQRRFEREAKRRWTLQINIIIYVSKVRRRLLCIKRSVALSPIE